MWEAGLGKSGLPTEPELLQAAVVCAFPSRTRKESRALEREVGLAVLQEFPFSLFFGHFGSTGKVKGLLFDRNRSSP